jgi:hypothetical protein
MPRKRKSSLARIQNLQGGGNTSSKRQKSTGAESNSSDESDANEEIMASDDNNLEANTVRSLDSIRVPLQMMRKFATRSRRFIDGYDRGLDGKQAAWAARKYRGHRVLPQDILEELGKEGLL